MPQPLALLCGLDGAHHFEDLWASGFSVERCDSEYELVRWLAYGKAPDLICVLESSDRPVDEASLALVKRGTRAPLVLFKARASSSRALWNLEVPPGTPAGEWLRSVDALMKQSRPR
jgi:hypothetical protein